MPPDLSLTATAPLSLTSLFINLGVGVRRQMNLVQELIEARDTFGL